MVISNRFMINTLQRFSLPIGLLKIINIKLEYYENQF